MASLAAWPCADPQEGRASVERAVDALEERARRFCVDADTLPTDCHGDLIEEGFAIMSRNDELRAVLAEWSL